MLSFSLRAAYYADAMLADDAERRRRHIAAAFFADFFTLFAALMLYASAAITRHAAFADYADAEPTCR